MHISVETQANELIKDYSSHGEFEKTALSIFEYQFNNNTIYNQYCCSLGKMAPKRLEEIPFLPISFFKDHLVSTSKQHETVFLSSGTTGSNPSRHFVHNLEFYRLSFLKCFELFYGNPKEFSILALLPSYMERKGSSLIMMVEDLIKKSADQDSGFFLYDHGKLLEKLSDNGKACKKTLLIGVSFALLDFCKAFKMQGSNSLLVMETGGMKGRRKEMIREELHQELQQGLGVQEIHSEYGMTELLSQAYSKKRGIFSSPPWMKILVREQDDPFSYCDLGRSGGINVIDFANLHSCSFIATQDLGKQHQNGDFEVLGRFDSSEIRGCSLMIS